MARRYAPAVVRFRPASADDSRTCFAIFEAAIDELGARTGGGANATAGDPEAWEVRRPLFEHLAATADAWWIAEDEATSGGLGYARSILRDGVRELTEFFVRPEVQARGIGRGLLERTFPSAGARHRAIVATVDTRAIARYLRAGLAARASMAGFVAAPRSIAVPPDLSREPIGPEPPPETLGSLGDVDRAVLGFRRDVDHRWLASQRPGWLYRRGGAVVAYGYHPARPLWGGPFAALDPSDLPVLLADAETAAAAAGHDAVSFDLPLVARPAIDHLLGRGLRVDPFVMLFFTDGPVDGLDRYCLTSPPFFA